MTAMTPAERKRAEHARKDALGLVRVCFWVPLTRLDDAKAAIAAIVDAAA